MSEVQLLIERIRKLETEKRCWELQRECWAAIKRVDEKFKEVDVA